MFLFFIILLKQPNEIQCLHDIPNRGIKQEIRFVRILDSVYKFYLLYHLKDIRNQWNNIIKRLFFFWKIINILITFFINFEGIIFELFKLLKFLRKNKYIYDKTFFKFFYYINNLIIKKSFSKNKVKYLINNI